MIITGRHHRTATTVSNRLYTRLKVYADDNELLFHSVVEQLRDQIHSEAVATNNPTDTQHKFAKGDRAKLSPEGIQTLPRKLTDRCGTVAANPSKHWIAVRWDGTKTVQYLSRDFLEQSDD